MPLQLSKWHFDIDDYINPWLPAVPWNRIPYPIARFLGHREDHQHPLGNIVMIFWAFIGVFCSLNIVMFVSRAIPSFEDHGAPIIIGSFGAAAVLEFYAIESPLSQPRNAILGQLFASIIGVTIGKLFALGSASRELTWLAGSLSCACAVAFMALTGTIHPPAGATALLAVVDGEVAHLGWFLLPVVLLGCILMQCMALLLNNIQRRFPMYWWTPAEVGRKQEPKNQQRNSECGSETGAKLKIDAASHLEGEAVDDQAKVVIMRGRVVVPKDLYLSPEEKLFLEELSGRI
ncbi:HPP family protein [Jackrogersella minutella]|nr:HPP family protein [Jackrogersella minutella]